MESLDDLRNKIRLVKQCIKSLETDGKHQFSWDGESPNISSSITDRSLSPCAIPEEPIHRACFPSNEVMSSPWGFDSSPQHCEKRQLSVWERLSDGQGNPLKSVEHLRNSRDRCGRLRNEEHVRDARISQSVNNASGLQTVVSKTVGQQHEHSEKNPVYRKYFRYEKRNETHFPEIYSRHDTGRIQKRKHSADRGFYDELEPNKRRKLLDSYFNPHDHGESPEQFYGMGLPESNHIQSEKKIHMTSLPTEENSSETSSELGFFIDRQPSFVPDGTDETRGQSLFPPDYQWNENIECLQPSFKTSNKVQSAQTEKYECVPGVLSDRLRHALGIGHNDIPEHVYRMRRMPGITGYPPAYLQLATIYPIENYKSDLKLRKPPYVDCDLMYCYEGFNKPNSDLKDLEDYETPEFEEFCDMVNNKLKEDHRIVETQRQAEAIARHNSQIKMMRAERRGEKKIARLKKRMKSGCKTSQLNIANLTDMQGLDGSLVLKNIESRSRSVKSSTIPRRSYSH